MVRGDHADDLLGDESRNRVGESGNLASVDTDDGKSIAR